VCELGEAISLCDVIVRDSELIFRGFDEDFEYFRHEVGEVFIEFNVIDFVVSVLVYDTDFEVIDMCLWVR
jgi:hypothetical protein